MKEYHNLLKNPKWWRKRKFILKRDNNKCTVCGSTKKLRIHHTYYYDKDTSPWLYPNKSLLTLCDKCHNNWHRSNEIVIIKKPKANLYIPVSRNELALLNCYEIEYISKKGSYSFNHLYGKNESDVLLKKRKDIKEVIKIKKVKNHLRMTE